MRYQGPDERFANRTEFDFLSGAQDADEFFCFNTVSDRKCVILQLGTRIEVAVLAKSCFAYSHRAPRLHRSFLSDHATTFHMATVCTALDENGRDSTFSVQIVICGPLLLSAKVGELLSRAKLFLQRPYHEDESVPYENSHILEFPQTTSIEAESDSSALAKSQPLILMKKALHRYWTVSPSINQLKRL
jgi:hypothetical protein